MSYLPMNWSPPTMPKGTARICQSPPGPSTFTSLLAFFFQLEPQSAYAQPQQDFGQAEEGKHLPHIAAEEKGKKRARGSFLDRVEPARCAGGPAARKTRQYPRTPAALITSGGELIYSS